MLSPKAGPPLDKGWDTAGNMLECGHLMLREAREKGAAILKARGDAGTGGPFSRGEVKSVAYMGNVEEVMSQT